MNAYMSPVQINKENHASTANIVCRPVGGLSTASQRKRYAPGRANGDAATIFDRLTGQGCSEKEYGDADHTIFAGVLKHLYALRCMVSWATTVAAMRDIVATAYKSEGNRLPVQSTSNTVARLAKRVYHLGFSIVKDTSGFSQDDTLLWVLFASVFFIALQVFRLLK